MLPLKLPSCEKDADPWIQVTDFMRDKMNEPPVPQSWKVEAHTPRPCLARRTLGGPCPSFLLSHSQFYTLDNLVGMSYIKVVSSPCLSTHELGSLEQPAPLFCAPFLFGQRDDAG